MTYYPWQFLVSLLNEFRESRPLTAVEPKSWTIFTYFPMFWITDRVFKFIWLMFPSFQCSPWSPNLLHILPSGPGGQDGTICGALTGSSHLKVPHPFNIDAITLALRGICASARALVTYRTSLQSNLRKPPEIDEQWNQWVFLLSVLKKNNFPGNMGHVS